jgi:hypothetical protein
MEPNMEEQNLHITSINTNGIDKEKIAQLIELKQYDKKLIQETPQQIIQTTHSGNRSKNGCNSCYKR